jgi:hypothetical protein
MEKRTQTLKLLNVSHLAIAAIVVLIFLNWLMPYFAYEPNDAKDLKTQTSMWGEILFPYNFMQLQDYMKEKLNTNGEKNFKYISLRHLGSVVIMMVCGIIILCTIAKRGIISSVIPVLMSGCGIKAYLMGGFLPTYANVTSGRMIGMVLAILLTLATLAKLYFNVMEIKSRPDEFYLPSIN